MEISQIVFKKSALLGGPSNHGVNGGPCGVSFEATPTAEVCPAPIADDDKVIGWVVGKLSNGQSTVQAIKTDASGFLSHGPWLPYAS